MKNPLYSRLVWLGFVTGSLGFLNALEPIVTDPKIISLVSGVTGFLTFILRVFFTHQPVARSPFIKDELGD